MNSSSPGILLSLIPFDDSGTIDVAKAQYNILPRTGNAIDYYQIDASSGSCRLLAYDIKRQTSDSFFIRDITTAAAEQTVTDVEGKQSKYNFVIL